MRYLGAHMSIAGHLTKAFDRIRSVGGTALQIFTRNQRQWKIPTLPTQDVKDFAAAWRAWGAYPVVAHDSYLINLAGNKKEAVAKSLDAFTEELRRIEALSIAGLVTHPGSHLGAGVEQGLKRYVRRLDHCFANSGTTQGLVLLETTAGQGTNLGGRFEDLAWIIEHSQYPERLGVCLDTCHAFAAGYELRTTAGYQETREQLERTVGLDRVRCVHCNDSKFDLGSRKDRHEHIAHGYIGGAGFAQVVNDPAFEAIPCILETPKSNDLHEDAANMQVLRDLVPK